MGGVPPPEGKEPHGPLGEPDLSAHQAVWPVRVHEDRASEERQPQPSFPAGVGAGGKGAGTPRPPPAFGLKVEDGPPARLTG